MVCRDCPARGAEMTKIGWTDETWNPTTGCDRISPGCDNCYALALAGRLKRMGAAAYQNDGGKYSGPGFGLTMHPDRLDTPRRWTRPRLIFVNSMSDLFHPKVSDSFIDSVLEVAADTPRHIYQILTKRPGRAQVMLRRRELPGNVWLGTSIESRAELWRLDRLKMIDGAAILFVSFEPLLEDLNLWHGDLRHIDWVIVGGESGPRGRPFSKDWARAIRDQCAAANIAFFFKQGSAALPGRDRDLDGRTYEEFPYENPD